MVKGPFMEFLDLITELSAANTTTTKMIQTPTSKSEKLAMLIHRIDYEFPTHAKQDIFIQASIVDYDVAAESKSLIGDHVIDSAKMIFKFTTSGMAYKRMIEEHHFDPPVLFTKQKVGLQGRSTGAAAALIVRARIGYTLEKVDKDDYIDALVV